MPRKPAKSTPVWRNAGRPKLATNSRDIRVFRTHGGTPGLVVPYDQLQENTETGQERMIPVDKTLYMTDIVVDGRWGAIASRMIPIFEEAMENLRAYAVDRDKRRRGRR